jgi:hypothetical protein
MIAGPCPNRYSTASSHEWILPMPPNARIINYETVSMIIDGRDQLRARVEDYQREVERRDEMLAASDHREAELRAEVERLRAVVRQFTDGDDFVFGKGHTESSVAGHAALSEGEEGSKR